MSWEFESDETWEFLDTKSEKDNKSDKADTFTENEYLNTEFARIGEDEDEDNESNAVFNFLEDKDDASTENQYLNTQIGEDEVFNFAEDSGNSSSLNFIYGENENDESTPVFIYGGYDSDSDEEIDVKNTQKKNYRSIYDI